MRRFEALGERLVRAGIAPRRVRRSMQELHDHYQEAVREEVARGANPADAMRFFLRPLPDRLQRRAVGRDWG